MFLRHLCLAAIVVLTCGCVSRFIRKNFKQEQLFVTMVSGSLFNQQNGEWHNDWILRRERLRLIDAELLRLQPDVVILQEVMAKMGSAYDSDEKILGARSLADFSWSSFSAHYYQESDQEEYLTVAAKQSLLEERHLPEPAQYAIGQDGMLLLHRLPLNNQPALAVGHIILPESAADNPDTLAQLRQRIDAFLQAEKLCPQRLVLAGVIPLGTPRNLREFFNYFELEDRSLEYCRQNPCEHILDDNRFFAASKERPLPSRLRIFTPQSCTQAEVDLAFAKPQDTTLFADNYRFSQLWPTASLGWMTRAKFARCR